MTKFRALLVVVIVLLIWEIWGTSIKSQLGITPVFGVTVIKTETIALKPGQAMTFGPIYPASQHIRYDLNSSFPVTTGISRSPQARLGDNCVQNQALVVQQDCFIPQNGGYYVSVADVRNVGDVVGSALFSRGQGLENNRVSLSWYGLGCIRNCPAPGN